MAFEILHSDLSKSGSHHFSDLGGDSGAGICYTAIKIGMWSHELD